MADRDIFCVLPFIHLQMRNGGSFAMCCQAPAVIKDDTREYNFGEDRAEEVFNSNYLINARRAMAENEPLHDCRVCYRAEGFGGGSYRMRSNLQFLANTSKEKVIAEFRAHDHKAPYRPRYLHLNLSNLCNLRCRMCFAGNSSEIEADPIHRRWAPAAKPAPERDRELVRKKVAFFRDNKLSIEDMLGDVRDLEEIYFTGGEPMLMPSVNDALRYLIDKGVSGQIAIVLNTNATASNSTTVDFLKKFKSVRVALSLDGVGQTYEYIRYPGRWHNVETNITKLQESLPEAKFSAAPTVGIYNMFGMCKLLDFCQTNGIFFESAQALYGPLYLAATILPQSARDEAADELDSRGALAALSKFFRSAPSTYTPDLLTKFMLFTNDLDRSRGQDFKSACPQVIEHLEKADVHWSDETRFFREESVTPDSHVRGNDEDSAAHLFVGFDT